MMAKETGPAGAVERLAIQWAVRQKKTRQNTKKEEGKSEGKAKESQNKTKQMTPRSAGGGRK
jgi:hypothetical protein